MIKNASSAMLLAIMTLIFLLLYSSADFSQATPAPELSSIEDFWNTTYYILEAVIFLLISVDKTISSRDVMRAAWLQMAIFTFIRFAWEIKCASTSRSVNEKEIMAIFAWLNGALMFTIPLSNYINRLYLKLYHSLFKLIQKTTLWTKKIKEKDDTIIGISPNSP
jgi:NhaP-type Na+/H+ or K+/H+ antiporter